jgi:hypothetical protein
MPIIDLGGWPDKRDSMAMHWLWALMAFPEDSKKQNQYITIFVSSFKNASYENSTKQQLSKPLSEEDEKKIEFTNLIHGLRVQEAKKKLELEYELRDGEKTLLHSPSYEEIMACFEKAFREGSIAGEMLFLLRQMNDANLRGGPSINKVIHIFENCDTKESGKDNNPANRRFWKETVWPKYKSVAHLWAAYFLWMENKCPDEYSLDSDKGLIVFLNVAEKFRKFITSFLPHGCKEPLISDDETWLPPQNLPPSFFPEIELPKLTKLQLKTLKKYQAPQQI